MFWNLQNVIDHNKAFWNAMVDLKVQGWKAFSQASDAYTSKFFSKQFSEADSQVEKFGVMLKGEHDVK